MASAGFLSPQTSDKHGFLPSNNLKDQRQNHHAKTSSNKSRINTKSPSTKSTSESSNGAKDVDFPRSWGRRPAHATPDDNSSDTTRRKRLKKARKPKPLSTQETRYKLFGCTYDNRDTDDDSPCPCQSNALLTLSPPINFGNDETTSPILTPPRLSSNGDRHHVDQVETLLVGARTRSGPSVCCPPGPTVSSISDPPASRSYPAETGATSLESRHGSSKPPVCDNKPTNTGTQGLKSPSSNPPKPACNTDPCPPLASAHPPPLADVETKNGRRDNLGKRFLAFLHRVAGGRARRGRRGGSSQSTRPRPNRNKSKSSANTTNPTASAYSRSGEGTSGQKRSTVGDDGADTDDQDDSNDGADRKPSKRSKPNTTPERRFPCPFFKHDPIKHWNCSSFTSDNWSHVKQHLERKHYDKFHSCPRCRSRFDRRKDCDEHIRGCNAVPGQERPENHEEIGGEIGADEQRALEEQIKPRRQINDYDRWNIAWRILFPETDPPPFPYAQDPRIKLRDAFLRPLSSSSFAARLVNEGLVPSEANSESIINFILSQVRAVQIPEEPAGPLTGTVLPSQDMEAGDFNIMDAFQSHHNHPDPHFSDIPLSQEVELSTEFTDPTQGNMFSDMPDIYSWVQDVNTGYEDGPQP